jgi:hypothetical protein
MRVLMRGPEEMGAMRFDLAAFHSGLDGGAG